MHDDDRGKIKHPKRYKQLMCFGEMVRHRNITPTDIDGVYDYNGVAFLYLEGKHVSKTIEYGQKLFYQNICKSHQKAGNEAAVIIFSHNMRADQLINVATQSVTCIYFDSTWTEMSGKSKTVIEMVERFEMHCKKRGLKI